MKSGEMLNTGEKNLKTKHWNKMEKKGHL